MTSATAPIDPIEPYVPRIVLALDTSGDVCSVAVLKDGLVAAELAFRHEMHLSERLISHIDALLNGESLSLRDVDCFVAGIGPGSFTGTRIGVMTAKTFGFIERKPVAPVNGLEAMASEYCGIPGLVVTPILSCRAGVVYACPYSVAGEAPEPIAQPQAFTFAELGERLREQPATAYLFCGPAARRYENELRESLGDSAGAAAFGTVVFPRASALARVALKRIASGGGLADPLEITPLYISPPPITLPKHPIPT